MSCPDEQALQDFFEGRLMGGRLAAIEEHLGRCSRCADNLGALADSNAVPVGPGAGPAENSPGRSAPDNAGGLDSTIGVGTTLAGKYRVIGKIGQGAMGTVFEVEHLSLQSHFAVKVLATRMGQGSAEFDRFRQEARVTSALTHPNIVRLFDFAQTPSGRPYVIMELLHGPNLGQYRRQRERLGLAEVLEIVAQIASGLNAAHRKRIVHRDLKPQNVIITRDDGGRLVAKLVDFGLAKVIEGSLDLSREGSLIGTPRYMAPEQFQGCDVELGEAADQFALAVMTFELLTGKLPFEAESLEALAMKTRFVAPPAIDELIPGLPPHVGQAISRALSKRPDARFPSVVAFVEALSGATADRSLAIDRRVAAALAAGAVVVVVGIATFRAPPKAATPLGPSILETPKPDHGGRTLAPTDPTAPPAPTIPISLPPPEEPSPPGADLRASPLRAIRRPGKRRAPSPHTPLLPGQPALLGSSPGPMAPPQPEVRPSAGPLGEQSPPEPAVASHPQRPKGALPEPYVTF